MKSGFSANLAELIQLLFDLVVTLLVVSGDIVAGLTDAADPRTELTFSSCHKIIDYKPGSKTKTASPLIPEAKLF
jgi:hypothetical protein